MGCVFGIHNEFGRLFDERIYKQELARRFPGVELEFAIDVSHGTFATTYFLDALIANGGPFEFKAVEKLAPRHRGQLYNYLLLLDLAHGKLVNLRSDCVEHEFVNATIRPADRHCFRIDTQHWITSVPRADFVRESLVDLLHDWGTGLEVTMYEAALTYYLGGEERVVREIPVRSNGHDLGVQGMRLVADDVAFKLTAFEIDLAPFAEHARRLLRHVDLRAIMWVNIGLQCVTFTTIV
jgi:GxxExxY protein